MAKTYNLEIVDAIRDFLDKPDGHYSFDEEKGHFSFKTDINGNMKNVQFIISVDKRDYVVYAISPVSVDQDDPVQLFRMAEFILRANYGLKNGNFEMDFNDGELRYKCFVNCDGTIPNRTIVGDSICCPAAMFEQYSKGILQILFNDMPAKDAVNLCEEVPEFHTRHNDDLT